MSGEKTPWLEYRLEALEFHNGAKIGFAHARMLYRDDDRQIMIAHLGSPPPAVDRVIGEAFDSPIKTIFYEMRVKGYPPQAFFFHPIKRSARLYLKRRAKGENVLLFDQVEGRSIFSKDWTLREVTQGRIPDDRRVWQFHGYNHEH